jgi:O-antigen/teichoic acid export membrane protein
MALTYQITHIKQKLLASKLVNDSFWAILGNVMSKGLALAAGIVIARFLGKEIFGEYSIIKTSFIYLGFFSTLGLGYTSTKFIAENKNINPSRVRQIVRTTITTTLIISILMMVLLLFGAEFFADKGLSSVHLKTPLRLLSVLIVFNALITTQTGILAGLGRFKDMAKVNVLTGLTAFLTGLFLTYYFKLEGALSSMLITQLLNCILNIKLINSSIKKDKSDVSDNRLIREIISFSAPVALQESFYYVMTWLSNFLLIRLASFAELGLYTAAMQWNGIILFIPGILRNVILTNLSEVNDNDKRHSSIIKNTLLINFSVTLILSAAVYFFSPYINILYGISFEGLEKLISLAVIITVFGSMSDIYSQAYMSKGLTWLMFYIRICRDGAIIALFLILINKNSSNAAKALIISTMVMNVIFLFIMILLYRGKTKKQIKKNTVQI